MPIRQDAPKLTAVPAVAELARARLPTRHGQFHVIAFEREDGQTIEDIAIVKGDVRNGESVPTRVHSECVTGEVFSSLRCDCRDQLELALERMAASERGVLLYLRQEGRGIGLAQKIRAYELQDSGLDTVDANKHLGFDDDLRTYELAAAMLTALGVDSIVLHTNNPRKLTGLRDLGVNVMSRQSLIPELRDENRGYVATKRSKSGHLADD